MCQWDKDDTAVTGLQLWRGPDIKETGFQAILVQNCSVAQYSDCSRTEIF